jgi:hypothetical protein
MGIGLGNFVVAFDFLFWCVALTWILIVFKYPEPTFAKSVVSFPETQ